MAPKRHKKRCAAAALDDDPIITDIDTDSDFEQHAVRLPSGLALDMPPPTIPGQAEGSPEQECQRQLLSQCIEMNTFQWLATDIKSDPLRPSALSKRPDFKNIYSWRVLPRRQRRYTEQHQRLPMDSGSIGTYGASLYTHAIFHRLPPLQCTHDNTP